MNAQWSMVNGQRSMLNVQRSMFNGQWQKARSALLTQDTPLIELFITLCFFSVILENLIPIKTVLI